MSINTAVIMGRMVADPELRKTPSGASVVSFTVAVDNGKDQEPAWVDCVAWNKSAEMVANWFKKGRMIGIEGRLQTRNFEDKQGNKRKATEIVCNRISFCSNKDNGSGANRGTEADFGGNAGQSFEMREVYDEDGDLPFCD